MNLNDLLAELRARDIHVRADGDRLKCSAPADALTPELRDRLQQCRSELLDFLRSAETLTQHPRAIVPLQPRGGGTPVFAVGGHNGDVFCFRALAAHLGVDQPFYGLQPPGLDGRDEPLTRVEELAAYFADPIREFHREGPLVVAGYCAGGSIAFELAQQLRRQGADVLLLALFGAPFPRLYGRGSQMRLRFQYQREWALRHVRALASMSFGDCRRYLVEKIRGRRALSAMKRSQPPDEVLALRARVERSTIAAARRYTPKRYEGRVHLLVPSRQWARSLARPLRWRKVAPHCNQCFGPDGCDSDKMLREPFAPVFAGLFVRAMRHHHHRRAETQMTGNLDLSIELGFKA